MNKITLVTLTLAVTVITEAIFIGPQPAQGITFIPPSGHKAPAWRILRGRSLTRGIAFTPAPGQQAPREAASGGGSRSGIAFKPASDRSAPWETASGGGSRVLTLFKPASDQKTPTETASSGGARGQQCLHPSRSSPSLFVTALMPQNQFGLTISARPNILVYLPPNDAEQIFFSVKDEDRQLHYQTVLPSSKAGGVVTFPLPEAAPDLAVDKNYQWYVALMCGGKLRASSPLVDGWIKRIKPDQILMQSLSAATPLAKVETLAAAGIWYDTVATLARIRRMQPADATIGRHWQALMNSVALEDLSTASLSP